MLKVVVFDSGYGGEFFADQLQSEVPIIDIIRVIDWRNADGILSSAKEARRIAAEALRPYIGKVDLIIFANHLLTVTSLRYFRRKYKEQSFTGLFLKAPDTFVKRNVLVLSTKAVIKTLDYHNYIVRLKRRTKSLALDTWPAKIDDGELTKTEIKDTLDNLLPDDFRPQEIVLACSQFNDIKSELMDYFGFNTKIYDSFDDTIREACKILKIRGGSGKKSS